MPYRIILKELQSQLETERNQKRKRELEIHIAVMLALITIMDNIEALAKHMLKDRN